MKALFYTTWALSLLQFIMIAITPFGGLHTFVVIQSTGMFFNVKNPSPAFTLTHMTLTYIWLVSFFLSLMLPLIYMMKPDLKYKLGSIFGSIAFLIYVLGGNTLRAIFI